MNILSRCEFTRADCSCYRLHVIIFLINKTLNMSGILCLTCCGQGLATYRSGVDLLQDLLAREIFFMYLEVKLLFLWTPLLAFSVVWWITWNNFLHRWVFFKPEAAQITFTSIWKLFFFYRWSWAGSPSEKVSLSSLRYDIRVLWLNEYAFFLEPTSHCNMRLQWPQVCFYRCFNKP